MSVTKTSLPKPYYEEPGVVIYRGDCREIVPLLPGNSVLVTDPPYGVDFTGKNTKHTTRRDDGYISGDSHLGPAVVQMALPSSIRGLVFSGIRQMYMYPEPFDIGCVYCPSGAGIGKWGFTCFHPILFYGKRPTSAQFPSSLMSFETSERNGHPCPKPLGWMRWSVKLASLESETILDPFMGSGTTLVAAKQLGRKAIGIEIEEKYCEIAVKRLAQEQLQFPAPKAELPKLQTLWESGHPERRGIELAIEDNLILDAKDSLDAMESE